MTFEELNNRIERYIDSSEHLPLLVDVPNAIILRDLVLQYDVGHYDMLHANRYCQKDCLPMMDRLKNDLQTNERSMFLFDVSLYLQLMGRKALKDELRALLQISNKGKLVIVTMGCADILSSFDHRLFESRRIVIVDGEPSQLPVLNFISPNLKNHIPAAILGINEIQKMSIFLEAGADSINIITDKHRSDFPMFDITECNSAYQIVLANNPILNGIKETVGKEEQWLMLLNELSGYDDFSQYITKKFGNTLNLSFTMDRFSKLNEFEKWLYFLSLLVFGAKDNSYLSLVISKSSTFDEFINKLYGEILNHAYKDKNFKSLYEKRKIIVAQLKEYSDELSTYCKMVYGKQEEAFYYLTDNSVKEKEIIIELLDKYKPSRDKILDLLKMIYPDLASYLAPYDFGNPYLNNYFALYKYCKVTNQILPDFKELVNEQASKRQYNEWLKPRSLLIDGIQHKGTNDILYFMDAMGVEFLSFMQEKCFESGLLMTAEIARCQLPSITSMNKDFVQDFKSNGCMIIDNKELDKIKHEGQNTYNYDYTKLPIHLVEELNILNRLIDHIKSLDISKRVHIIADHGASRLAVINETENKWEVSEKGQHSGRCCPKSDISEKPEFATEESDFWCLANYDRFKGGRRANVEVHGGASLEEVVIPVISIVKAKNKIVCKRVNDAPILVSFKRIALMTLFVEVESGEVSITTNGNKYIAKSNGTNYQYDIEMPDIKKAGIYSFNVYLDNALIAKDLQFEIKKEGASERKFF